MKDLPLSFKLTCNYCYRTLPEQMTVCKCGSTVCPTHTNYHFVSVHTPAFFLIKAEEIKVYSDCLTEQECEMISQYINTNLVPCKHLNNIPPEKVSFLPNCEECDIRENLYCCLICGFTGCPREQYGSDGRGHALKHSLEKEHCVSVNMSREVFCYECDKFIKFDTKSKVNFKNSESKNHLEKELELNKDGSSIENSCKLNPITLTDVSTESTELESKFVGIDNLGNTCFISSVMQLLAIVTEEMNLEEHFIKCNKLPLECLVCQSVRLLVALQKGKKTPIDEFIDLIYKEETFVIFQRNFQQDASEFFIFYWNFLKENLTLKFMDLETITVMECDCKDCNNENCSKKRQRVESFFLFVPCEDNVSDSLIKSFESEEKKCPCDKNLVIKNYIRILPDYLVLIINRWNNDGTKNNKVIECDNLNLKDVYYQTIPYQKSILVYDEERIRKAMILEDNDEEKATNRLLKDDLHLREDLNYNLVGAICHKGETITSGHYVFVKKEDQIIVLDDEEVKFGDGEWFKKAYIVLYK